MPRDAKGKFLPGKRGFAFRTLNMSNAKFADEIVKATFLLMQTQRISIPEMSKRSGVGIGAILRWRTEGRQPDLGNLRAVLQVLGKDLDIVDKV